MQKSHLYQINVTRDCNLRCTHCYINSEAKDKSQNINDEQIIGIAHGILEHMTKIGYEHAEIHFVGGEPTMLGLKFFEDNIPKFRSIIDKGHFKYDLSMISNLLHPDILAISKFFDGVNTSYEIKTRFISKKGNDKPILEQKWLDNVHLLQENKIKLGITTAITKPVINFGAEKLLEFYLKNNIKQIHFGFFIPIGDGLINKIDILPSFEETSQFLIKASIWYIEKRLVIPDLFVNPFESMLSSIHNDEPLDDIVCPIIAGSMDINWDGNTTPCIAEGGEIDAPWTGNIFENSILKVSESEKYLKRVFEANKPQKICRTCDEYSVCKSACGILFKYFDSNIDTECPGFKKFIKFVRLQHEIGLIPKYFAYLGKSC